MLTLFPQSQPSLKDTRATFAVRAANKARERQSRRKQKIDLQRQKEIVSDTAEWKRILEKVRERQARSEATSLRKKYGSRYFPPLSSTF